MELMGGNYIVYVYVHIYECAIKWYIFTHFPAYLLVFNVFNVFNVFFYAVLNSKIAHGPK